LAWFPEGGSNQQLEIILFQNLSRCIRGLKFLETLPTREGGSSLEHNRIRKQPACAMGSQHKFIVMCEAQ
jgi:hypothetical protein